MLAGSASALGLVALLRLALERATPFDWFIVALVATVALSAIHHQRVVRAIDAGRREEAETLARILSGLSRSVSPDAIVTAIVRELGTATGADHLVVARRRPDVRILDATLVSTRPGVHDSSTTLPISDLEDPIDDHRTDRRATPIPIPIMPDRGAVSVASPVAAGGTRATSDGWAVAEGVRPLEPRTAATRLIDDLIDRGERAWDALVDRASRLPPRATPDRLVGAPAPGDPVAAQAVAERIAVRVRDVYGLRDTIAAPLATDAGVVGAIVLSRRVAGAWPASTRRILAGAALEASVALTRAYSLRAAEARASTDALTGLPNRRYFEEFCGLLARRRRAGDAVGVLMIDIDHFKGLNDTYGHAVGDEVLREVAGAISAAVRDDDVPARFGGEEFVVLLRNPSREIATDVGERVRVAVSALDLGTFGVPAVSVSVGVAVASMQNEAIDALVQRADRALYRAKRSGRDRVVAE